jgi:hypothetical protein
VTQQGDFIYGLKASRFVITDNGIPQRVRLEEAPEQTGLSLFMAINAMKENASSELAELSGGEYLNFTTRKGFDQALGHLANQVHNFYLLSFQPQNTPAAGYHTLRVSVPDNPDALIRNRTSYWSEPIQSSSDTH